MANAGVCAERAGGGTRGGEQLRVVPGLAGAPRRAAPAVRGHVAQLLRSGAGAGGRDGSQGTPCPRRRGQHVGRTGPCVCVCMEGKAPLTRPPLSIPAGRRCEHGVAYLAPRCRRRRAPVEPRLCAGHPLRHGAARLPPLQAGPGASAARNMPLWLSLALTVPTSVCVCCAGVGLLQRGVRAAAIKPAGEFGYCEVPSSVPFA